jgi:Family of unknown function (DUF5681)
MAENSAQEQRKRGRPFPKGVSGNPAGKPKGMRNKATLLLAAISEDDLTAIIDKLVAKAKSGDLTAIKILLDRLVPPPKYRAVALDLPPLNAGTARSKASALGAVLEAMAAGQIDPAEAEAIARLVEATAEAAQNCGGF